MSAMTAVSNGLRCELSVAGCQYLPPPPRDARPCAWERRLITCGLSASGVRVRLGVCAFARGCVCARARVRARVCVCV